MNQDLIVKRSTLPGAGKGLFAKREIKKGERFIEYLGEVITEGELNRRANRNVYGYSFYINRYRVIDAYYTPKELARYANDAHGLRRKKGIKNNCSYVIYNHRCWIMAERTLKPGEEIFVSYGASYWSDIRYNLHLQKEKSKQKRKAR
ncbi:MAG: SET domain-containing protein [Bacteroidia bacterium]